METKLLNPSPESIDLACELLKQGEVVAIPTETVYGLAGDSTNPSAINKIFKAKGRPSDNPLIVHIADMQMLNGIVKEVPEDAKILAKNFTFFCIFSHFHRMLDILWYSRYNI